MENVIYIGCWAHICKRNNDAVETSTEGKKSTTVVQSVAYYTQLPRIEEQLKNLSTEECRRQRLEQKKPALDTILAWANTRIAAPKAKLGEAVQYLKNRWPTLTVYLQDGRIMLNNNRAESSIKPFVISGKGFLFANAAGVESYAILSSLIETAK